jgi:hypothetical protein
LYSSDVDSLVKAIPRPADIDEARFRPASEAGAYLPPPFR